MPGLLLVEKITHDVDLSEYNSFFNPQFFTRVTPGLNGTAGALEIDDSGSLLTYARKDFTIFPDSLWGIKFLLKNNLTSPGNKKVTVVSCRNALGEVVLKINIRITMGSWLTDITFRDDNLVEQTHTASLLKIPEVFDLQFISGVFDIISPSPITGYLGTYGTLSGLAEIRVGHLDIVPPPLDGIIIIDEIEFYTNNENSVLFSGAKGALKNRPIIYKTFLLDDKD